MHIHRECIIETKWKYDVAPEDKQLAFKQMIINFIEVNFQALFTQFNLYNFLSLREVYNIYFSEIFLHPLLCHILT